MYNLGQVPLLVLTDCTYSWNECLVQICIHVLIRFPDLKKKSLVRLIFVFRTLVDGIYNTKVSGKQNVRLFFYDTSLALVLTHFKLCCLI